MAQKVEHATLLRCQQNRWCHALLIVHYFEQQLQTSVICLKKSSDRKPDDDKRECAMIIVTPTTATMPGATTPDNIVAALQLSSSHSNKLVFEAFTSQALHVARAQQTHLVLMLWETDRSAFEIEPYVPPHKCDNKDKPHDDNNKNSGGKYNHQYVARCRKHAPKTFRSLYGA